MTSNKVTSTEVCWFETTKNYNYEKSQTQKKMSTEQYLHLNHFMYV